MRCYIVIAALVALQLYTAEGAVKVGENCPVDTTTDCPANAACSAQNQPCLCTTGYTASADNTACKAKVGTACTADATTNDCVPGATCSANGENCACEEDKTANADNTACTENGASDVVASLALLLLSVVTSRFL